MPCEVCGNLVSRFYGNHAAKMELCKEHLYRIKGLGLVEIKPANPHCAVTCSHFGKCCKTRPLERAL